MMILFFGGEYMNIKLKRSELNSYMDKYNDEFLFSGTVSVKKGDDIIFLKQ